MTPRQRDLARHALGLPNKRRRSYRNRFVAGPGHDDHEEWLTMVIAGYATRRSGGPITGGDDCFFLTHAGAREAIARQEYLDPEDFPR